jgi:hypothetical protein
LRDDATVARGRGHARRHLAQRDATSPRTVAEHRGYDEIVAMMVAQEAHEAKGAGDGLHRGAMRTGGEQAVIAVFESNLLLPASAHPMA